jgi:hypothetical protein
MAWDCPNPSCTHSVISHFSGGAGPSEASKIHRGDEARIKRQKNVMMKQHGSWDQIPLTVVFTYCLHQFSKQCILPLHTHAHPHQKHLVLGKSCQLWTLEKGSPHVPFLASAEGICFPNALQDQCTSHGYFSCNESSWERRQSSL